MSMDINTNIDALNALRNLGTTSTAFSNSVSKLSSGLRINTAADDAAGLAISTKLQSQVTGLNQAQRNAQDGVSMVQTAEGALNQVQTMLQRIRELSVEAANSTLGASDAQSVNAEITALQAEITRTANTTTFNGQHLLTGALAQTVDSGSGVQVGNPLATATGSSITGVDVSGAASGTAYTISAGTAANSLKISVGGKVVDDNVAVTDESGGAGVQTLRFANAGISITVASNSSGKADDTAANIAADLVTMGNVTTAAGNGNAVFQIGANQGDTLQVTFADARTANLGGLDTAIANFTSAAGSGTGIAAAAGALITATDTAIGAVSTANSNFGAVENRLNDTVATLSVTSENLNASESRIKDLNVAAEMVNFTKTQILQQAGTAILAQANSAPQNILTLLR
jgi:flagellin